MAGVTQQHRWMGCPMKIARKLFGFLTTALILMGLAMPASAANPQKIYSMTVGQPGATVRVVVTNETPNGNSTINSFIIKPPTGLTVTVGTPAASRNGVAVSPATVTKDPVTGWIYVNGFDGLKAGTSTPKFIEINLNATYSGTGPVCGAYVWSAVVYTGNSFGQETFAQVDAVTKALVPPPGGVNQGQNCSVVFSPAPPAGIVSGTAITPVVGIQAFDGTGAPLPWNGIASFALVPQSTGASGSVTTPLTGTCVDVGTCSKYSYSGLTITSTAGGSFKLTATTSLGATAASASVTSSAFTVFASGPLVCAPGSPSLFSGSNPPNVDSGGVPVSGGLASTEPGYAEGQRGAANKDGSDCVAVGYTFTNNILSTDPAVKNSVTLRWDTNLQPNAAFAYTLTFIDETVDPSVGTPTSRTKVAWEFNADGTPKYKVYAVACIGPNLPTQLGTLGTALPATTADAVITINGSGLPTGTGVTFPIAIGPAATGSNTIERLQATWQSGSPTSSTYSVKRAQGGTPVNAHIVGAKVMTTPLPIDPNQYLPGTTSGTPNNPYYLKQANMCIADEGWSVVSSGGVRFTTTIYDIGDGFVGRDF
jgi:hypothetical protein